MKIDLIIFDMDGTLVQSEDCASQALLDVIPALQGTAQEISARYRGVKLDDIIRDIELKIPGSVPKDCIERYRERENTLSQTMITPTPGVEETLAQIKLAKCIASNAPVIKTKRSLEQCGLSGYFKQAIYSAYDIQAWKPDPALFLYAAEQSGVEAEHCLVVEDSEVGISAAVAAGMSSVLYNPHAELETEQADFQISSMVELLDIIRKI